MEHLTYKINGVALNDPAQGWTLVRGSIPVSGLEYTAPALDVPGVDGTVFLPSTRRPVALNLIIKSTLANRGKLLAVMSTPKLEITDDKRPGMVATGRLLSSTVEDYHEVKGWAKDLFIIEIVSGCWRGPQVTSTPKPLVAGGTHFTAYPGLTAPVQDGKVLITGPVQNPQVVDSNGSFFKLTGTVEAGSTLEVDLANGRAYIGAVEVSGLLDFGGPRGGFEITPSMPDMVGKLVLTAASYGTGSSVSVSGKPAYLF